MASRYGRNKRRADRERIAQLELGLKLVVAENSKLKRAVIESRNLGASDILNNAEEVKYAVHMITNELINNFEPALRDAAHMVLANQSNRYYRPVQFSARIEDAPPTIIIRGTIPQIDYNVAIARYPKF